MGIWKDFCEGASTMKHNPKFFFALIAIVSIANWFFWTMFYSNRISTLNDIIENNKEVINSYRIKTKELKPEITSMIELTNSSLKNKGNNLVSKIREYVDISLYHVKGIEAQFKNGEINAEKRSSMLVFEAERSEKQFRELRVDSLMTIDEMRERVPFEAREKVPTFPLTFKSADSPKSEVQPWKIFAESFTYLTARGVANEIEELGKLLPDKLDARCQPS